MGDDVLCNNVRYLQSGVTAHEVHETYDQWAASYDKDNVVMEYGGPRIAARKLSRLLQDKAQPILDVACGTGWVGKEVRRLDYNIIDGVDISEKSISIARDTMVYRDLKLCDINAGGLPYEDNSYGAIISVGSFMPNHLNQAVFPEFCRVTKPGNIFSLFFTPKVCQLSRKNTITRDYTISKTVFINLKPFGGLGDDGWAVSKTKKSVLSCKSPTKIGTLNVRTIRTIEKRQELGYSFEESSLQILAIQEYRILHDESVRTVIGKKSHLITTTAMKNASYAANGGVGFVLSAGANQLVREITPFSPRVLKMTLNGNLARLTVISVYSPTERDSDENAEVVCTAVSSTQFHTSL